MNIGQTIYKQWKVYRIVTVLKYFRESWVNSKFVLKKCPSKNRAFIYLDLLYWYVFYGDDFNDYCTFTFWNKSNRERKTYISLRRNDVLRYAFSTPEVHELFLDKAKFNQRFRKYINRGWLTTVNKSWTEIVEFIIQYRDVIAKPLKDYGGHGVFKICTSSDNYKDALDILEQKIVAGEQFIIEEIITNCEKLKSLAPGSLNTIRIVTVLDREKQLHILAALLRMGNGVALTDNYHDGGRACAIDLESSTLKGEAYSMNCQKYELHPYSHIKFDSFIIPDFDKCVSVVKEVAYYEPDARYVGWDLAITPNGVELLEGNIPPGEDITQIASGCGLWYQMQEWK